MGRRSRSRGKAQNRRRKISKSIGTSSSRMYRDGVVIVHGVGGQEPGDTLRQIVRPITEALTEQGVRNDFVEWTQDKISMAEIDTQDGSKILFADAHWAGVVDEHRVAGIKGTVIRLWFILTAFPYLFGAVLGPRAGESTESSSVPQRSPWRRISNLVGINRDELARNASIAWRGLSVYTGAVGIVVSYWVSLWLGIVLTVVLIAILIFISAWPTTVVEHVRLAAAQRAEMHEIQKRVSSTISHVEERCERVWVIAHSQGGYIVHNALSEQKETNHPCVTKFTAIASGIRPIKLAGLRFRSQWFLSGWMHLTGVMLITVGLLFAIEAGGFLNAVNYSAITVLLAEVIAFPVLSLSFPQALFDVLDGGFDYGWRGIVLFLVGCLIVAIGFMIRPRDSEDGWFIKDLPRHIEWEEASSVSDLVGSMSVPPLPERVRHVGVPTFRNAFFDHELKSYFSKVGALRYLIAASIAEMSLGGPKARGMRETAEFVSINLRDLSRHVYVLRGSLIFVALFFSLCVPMMVGRSIFAVTPTALVAGITASTFGWCLSYVRWKYLAPMVIGAAITGSQRTVGKVMKAPRPPLRVSVGLIQAVLVILTVLIAIGTKRAADQMDALYPSLSTAEHLDAAAMHQMSMALMLSIASICLAARMGGSKVWNTVGLLYGLLSLSELVSIAPTAVHVILMSGIVPVLLILFATVIQLFRCAWTKVASVIE